ncbi:MAG: SDR family NAD(P)-dependent oxidoreductase, partial [Candidatus Omnitrophica bacterium]|nr:SDR family NAD(P)-dependent oxidoreductase [Candidatus Omnitrophota bacterium]
AVATPRRRSRLAAGRSRHRSGDLSGRVALVTGASRGLGRAMALALSQAGASVIMWGRQASRLQQTSRAIESLGGAALIQRVDVTDPAAVRWAVSRARRRFGRIDILVNNAGIWDGDPFLTLSRRAWSRVMDARPPRPSARGRVLRGESRRHAPDPRDGGGAGAARDPRQQHRAGAVPHRHDRGCLRRPRVDRHAPGADSLAPVRRPGGPRRARRVSRLRRVPPPHRADHRHRRRRLPRHRIVKRGLTPLSVLDKVSSISYTKS